MHWWHLKCHLQSMALYKIPNKSSITVNHPASLMAQGRGRQPKQPVLSSPPPIPAGLDLSLSCIGVIWCCRIVVLRHCCMVLSHHHCCVLSCGFVVACWCIVVLHSCHVVVPHCLVVSEGGWNESAMTHQTGMMNDDQCCHLSFGCHVAISNMAPGFCMVISSVIGCLGSWVAVGVHGWSGSLYLIVGIGCCVVAVVGGIVVWWLWWLNEERRNVTCCDISVMFKLTHEITWIISHDNHIVYTVNTPSPGPVLGQPQLRWNSALRAGLSPAKLCPASSTNLVWPFYLWNPPELGRNYRGTIKTSKQQPGPPHTTGHRPAPGNFHEDSGSGEEFDFTPVNEHTPDGDVLDAPWPVSPNSVKPVAGSATSTQPATPSEQTSESSWSRTAPDIVFFFLNVDKRFPQWPELYARHASIWLSTITYVVLTRIVV